MKLPFLKGKGQSPQKETVSRYFTFIEQPMDVVWEAVGQFGDASWWPEEAVISFSREAQGDLKEGELLIRAMSGLLAPVSEVQITKFVPKQIIEWTFEKGYLKGTESIALDERYNGIKVIYEIRYEVRDPWRKIVWNILLKKAQDKEVARILDVLKEHCNAQSKDTL